MEVFRRYGMALPSLPAVEARRHLPCLCPCLSLRIDCFAMFCLAMSHLLCFYLMSVFCGVTTRVIHLFHMIIWYSYDTTVKCSNYSKFHVFSNRFHVMIHLVSWCFMFLQWLSYEETAELSFAAQLKAQLGHRRCGLGALTGTAWVGTEMRGPQMLVHVYPIIHVYPCLSISIHVYPCLSISIHFVQYVIVACSKHVLKSSSYVFNL